MLVIVAQTAPVQDEDGVADVKTELVHMKGEIDQRIADENKDATADVASIKTEVAEMLRDITNRWERERELLSTIWSQSNTLLHTQTHTTKERSK